MHIQIALCHVGSNPIIKISFHVTTFKTSTIYNISIFFKEPSFISSRSHLQWNIFLNAFLENTNIAISGVAESNVKRQRKIFSFSLKMVTVC